MDLLEENPEDVAHEIYKYPLLREKLLDIKTFEDSYYKYNYISCEVSEQEFRCCGFPNLIGLGGRKILGWLECKKCGIKRYFKDGKINNPTEDCPGFQYKDGDYVFMEVGKFHRIGEPAKFKDGKKEYYIRNKRHSLKYPAFGDSHYILGSYFSEDGWKKVVDAVKKEIEFNS